VSLLKRKPLKPRLLRSNPHRFTLLLQGYDPVEIEVYDDDIYVGYSRRPQDFRFIPVDDDEELSDYVKFRLWFARQMALKRYEEKWG
jgi:hypothetical protein